MFFPFVALVALSGSPESIDVGPFVRALWLFQRYGTADARHSKNDQRMKGLLSKALAKDGVITLTELGGLMEPETFNKLSVSDLRLDSADISRALEGATPESRLKLHAKVREHADYLTTTFDQIDELHREAGQKLAHWIASNYQTGKPLHITVVCTGNSRRSIMGSSMGNLAAAYYGMPEIRFHSGGTAPSAFNPRTVSALKSVGFEVEPTGAEAERGEPKTGNPIYRISWGEGFETSEFSKQYGDKTNPQTGFAALMVCSEADAACPFVKGASLRVSMPYLDPKIYDEGAYESVKYAERRDDIGRLMLSAILQARHNTELATNQKTPTIPIHERQILPSMLGRELTQYRIC
jgi:arsenate reductase (thioredoxin)